jgi:6,7-dimethyl-8-ribityllumazine synthase
MAHILIVSADFYQDLARLLTQGAVAALDEADMGYELLTVPGALEIPQVIRYGINRRRFDAYVALGTVIRGETSHYDTVSQESARGLMELSLQHLAPIGNGILTVENKEQAIERADPKRKNKGGEAAQAAITLLKHKKFLHG